MLTDYYEVLASTVILKYPDGRISNWGWGVYNDWHICGHGVNIHAYLGICDRGEFCCPGYPESGSTFCSGHKKIISQSSLQELIMEIDRINENTISTNNGDDQRSSRETTRSVQ